MRKGRISPLNSVAGVIRGLYPAHPYKAIERALGCSPRQAQRIVETGQVPKASFPAVLAFLKQSAEFNRQRQAELDAEIEAIETAQAEAAAGITPTLGGDP